MIKVGEYMAMGKPVACYDLAETRFTADAPRCYARPNEVADLARCVGELLDDPDFGRSSERSAGRAPRTLAWGHSERNLIAAYERALSKGTPERCYDVPPKGSSLRQEHDLARRNLLRSG